MEINDKEFQERVKANMDLVNEGKRIGREEAIKEIDNIFNKMQDTKWADLNMKVGYRMALMELGAKIRKLEEGK